MDWNSIGFIFWINVMESKTLQEINNHYVKEIVQFFCFEYYRMHCHRLGKSENNDIVNRIISLIDNQIKQRLSNMLHDWKIEIESPDFNLSERRNNIIENILEDKEIEYPTLKFRFYYQLNKGTDIRVLDVLTKL